jgi:hypothetical protein
MSLFLLQHIIYVTVRYIIAPISVFQKLYSGRRGIKYLQNNMEIGRIFSSTNSSEREKKKENETFISSQILLSTIFIKKLKLNKTRFVPEELPSIYSGKKIIVIKHNLSMDFNSITAFDDVCFPASINFQH